MAAADRRPSAQAISAHATSALDVWLQDRRIGTLVRTPGDFTAFSFASDYRAGGGLPILSLSFRAASGALRKDPLPIAGALPPFFANLLPEDRLRAAMERHHADRVRPGNDFDLLAALGADLPGAVRALPAGGEPVLPGPVQPGRKARFSLAGVQMKLSVVKNTGKGGGLTVPVGDAEGDYIAKFPSPAFPGLAENEFAILSLAAALDMDVPERELVETTDFFGIPKDFDTLAEGRVLLVRRFDRAPPTRRIHIEDFAQVFGLGPGRKYDGAACHDIAAALAQAISPAAALDFVRRLTLAALTGNGDMHLKNWSLIYPGTGHAPALAPAYDLLSTVPYMPRGDLALSLGGERAFKELTADRWKAFAHRAHLPEAATLQTVAATAAQAAALWPALPARGAVPVRVRDRIDAHIQAMRPILTAVTA